MSSLQTLSFNFVGKVLFTSSLGTKLLNNLVEAGFYGLGLLFNFVVYKDTPDQIARYLRKISGPILDRIDLHLEIPAVEIDQLTAPQDSNAETSEQVRMRVMAARERQFARQGCVNSELTVAQLEEFVPLKVEDQNFLKQSIERLKLSARSYHKILRIARTLADMADESQVNTAHLAEALAFRNLDRQGSGL